MKTLVKRWVVAIAAAVMLSAGFAAEVSDNDKWTIVRAGATTTYEKLSSALAELRDGDTLAPLVAGDKATFSATNLNPVSVDCFFMITNNDVTVDFRGRALTKSIADAGYIRMDEPTKSHAHLMFFRDAHGVTVKNGHLYGTTYRADWTLTDDDKRALKAYNGSEVTVTNCAIYAAALVDMIHVKGGSRLAIVDSWLDGQGDGSENTIRVRNGSTLVLKNVKGRWNPNNFWNSQTVRDTLQAVTGEQFVLENGTLELDNTSISNTITRWSQGYIAKPVVVSGKDNELVTKNGSQIVVIGKDGAKAPVIVMKSPTVEYPETRLSAENAWKANEEIVAASMLARVEYQDGDPTGWYLGITDAEQIRNDLGIEKITVEKPVVCDDGAVESCITVKTTDDSFLMKLYGHEPDSAKFEDVTQNLPSNVLTATVHNNDLKVAKDLNDNLRKFSPEIADLLSSFSNVVDGVTGGIAICTVPDESAADGMGKLFRVGVKGVEVWDNLTNELAKAGDIIEEKPLYPGDYRVRLNPNGRIGVLLGGDEPQLALVMSSGKFILFGSSSESVCESDVAQKQEGKTLLTNPTFKACAGDLLEKTRHGLLYVSPDFLKTAGEGACRRLGLNPDLVAELGDSWLFSTTVVDADAKTVRFMMRMPKGASGTVEAAGRLALRLFDNLHPELAGIVTFAEGYQPSAEAKTRLVQISDALLFLRDQLGVEGLDITGSAPVLGAAKTDVRLLAERDGALARLLANGRSGHGVAERYLPATAVAAWGFQPDAERAIGILDTILTRLGATEAAETVRAFQYRNENFAPDVAFAVTLGDATHAHEDGVSHQGLNFIAAQKLLNRNLWTSMQIALQRAGAEVEVKETGVVICHLPVSDEVKALLPYVDPAFCFVPDDNVILFSTSHETGTGAMAAGRDGTNRLVESGTFLTQMGGEFPAHRTFRYVAPKADADLILSLGEALKQYVPESLVKALLAFDVSAVWSTGVGNMALTDAQTLPGQTMYVHRGRTSSALYEEGRRVLDAAIDAFAASVSIAYPYDYTLARRFDSQLVSLSVDSVDENGKCRVRMIRHSTVEGAQDLTIDGVITMPVDRTQVARHVITCQNLTVKFVLSSEGVFGFEATDDECDSHTFILRESLRRPDFGDRGKGLTPAEIDAAVSNIWADLGIEGIVVREPRADEPEGAVCTKIEIDTSDDSFLYKLYDLEPDPATFVDNTEFLPSNALMATVCKCDLAWAMNAADRLRNYLPDVADLLDAFRDVADGVSGCICISTVPDAEDNFNGLGKIVTVGVKGIETWNLLTNKLSTAGEIESCGTPYFDEEITVRLKPTGALARLLGGREPQLLYWPRNGQAVIVAVSSDSVISDYRAATAANQFLFNNPTFRECAGSLFERSEKRGFKYVSPDFIPAVGKAALDLLGLPEDILDLEEFWDFSIIETDKDREADGNRIHIVSRMPQRAQELLEAIGRLGVNFVGNLLPTVKGTVKFDEEYEPSAAAMGRIADLVGTLKSVRETLGVTGLDYRYQPETALWRSQAGIPETGDEFYATMLAVGTESENSAFMRLVAAGEVGSNIAENYLPDSAVSVWAFQPDAATWIRAVSKVFARLGLEDVSDLLATTFPERFDGHSCAIAITSDETDLQKTDDGKLVYGAPGIMVAARAGTDASFRTLEWILKDKGWGYENADDLMVLRREGEEDGIRLAYSVPEGMLIVATSRKVLDATLAAGLKGSHRLCGSKDYRRVMGDALTPHNTLRYQNDGMLGRLAKQLANVFADIVPEGLITQILGADILNTAECGVGVKDGTTFFRYGRSPKSRFETSLPLARAAIQTLAEAVQAVYPYDGSEPRVFDSVFNRYDIGETDEDGFAVVRWRSHEGVATLNTWTFSDAGKMYEDETAILNVMEPLKSRGYAMDGVLFAAYTDIAAFLCNGDGRSGSLAVVFEREEEPELGIAIYVDGADEVSGVTTLAPNVQVEIPVTVMPATATLTAKNLPSGLKLKKVTLDAKAKTYAWVIKGKASKVGNYATVLTATLGKARKTVEPFYSFKVDHFRSDAIRLLDAYDFTAGVAVSTNLGADAVGCTVSGLPSGLKFNKKTGLVSGAPKKPGHFLVTFKKKVGKTTKKATTTFAVAGAGAIAVSVDFGLAASVSPDLQPQASTPDVQPQISLAVYAGVKVSYPISTLGLEGVETTVTAKGLPSGLKLVKTAVYVDPTAKKKVVDHYEYAIEGVPTAASKVDKKTGAVSPAKVVVSATNKYKWTGSQTFELTVLALPGWAVGTFDGVMTGVDAEDAFGRFTGTVGATGRISLKLTYTSALTGKGETATFSANGFERYNWKIGEFVIRGTVKTKSAARELNGVVFVDTETGLGRMQLADDDYARLGLFDGVQNGWKLKPVALPAFSAGSKALVIEDAASGLTLKFGANGAVSFSGKVAGDTKMVSVNGSAQLLPYAYGENVLFAKTLVYVAPKSGLSSGFIKAYDLVFWIGEDGKVESVGTILRCGQIAEVAKNVTDTTYVVSFSREDADVTAGQFTVRVSEDGIVKASGTIDGLSYSGTSDLVINSYGGIEIPVIATDKKGDIIVFKIDAPAVEEADVVELNIANVSLSKGETLVPAQIEIEEDAAAASANPYDVAPALYMGVKGFGFIPNTLED